MERCLLVQPSGKRGWNGTDSSVEAAVEAGFAAPRPTPIPPKDANQALLMGWNLNELLDEARVLPHEKILRVSDLRDQVSIIGFTACVCQPYIRIFSDTLRNCHFAIVFRLYMKLSSQKIPR